MYIHIHASTQTHTHTHTHTHAHTNIYIYIHIVYVCTHRHCMYVYMYSCKYTYMYVSHFAVGKSQHELRESSHLRSMAKPLSVRALSGPPMAWVLRYILEAPRKVRHRHSCAAMCEMPLYLLAVYRDYIFISQPLCVCVYIYIYMCTPKTQRYTHM